MNLSCMHETQKKPLEPTPKHKIVKQKIKQKVKQKKQDIKKEFTKPKPFIKKKVIVSESKKKPQVASPKIVRSKKIEKVAEKVVEKAQALPPSLTPQKKYLKENLAEIIELLQENLYYPRRARKRGIEGEVILRFKLSTTAEVSDIEVISSKSDILNRGAIRTIEELSYKFPKPSEELDLKVPIFYKLQ